MALNFPLVGDRLMEACRVLVSHFGNHQKNTPALWFERDVRLSAGIRNVLSGTVFAGIPTADRGNYLTDALVDLRDRYRILIPISIDDALIHYRHNSRSDGALVRLDRKALAAIAPMAERATPLVIPQPPSFEEYILATAAKIRAQQEAAAAAPATVPASSATA